MPFIFQKHYNLNLSREHVHCTLYTVLFWFKKCTNCSSSVHIVDQIFLIWFVIVLRPIPAATNALSSFPQVFSCVSP